jgi:hypothetical protein
MMEKHHTDQNPYISSLCPIPGVVTDNMTREDDVTQSLGLAELMWGRLAPPPWSACQGLEYFQNLSSTRVNISRQEGYPMWERRCYHKSRSSSQVMWSVGVTSGPLEPKLRPRHRLNPPINILPSEGVKK